MKCWCGSKEAVAEFSFSSNVHFKTYRLKSGTAKIARCRGQAVTYENSSGLATKSSDKYLPLLFLPKMSGHTPEVRKTFCLTPSRMSCTCERGYSIRRCVSNESLHAGGPSSKYRYTSRSTMQVSLWRRQPLTRPPHRPPILWTRSLSWRWHCDGS